MSGPYRCDLADMFCRKCASRHLVAYETFTSGELTRESPPLFSCYACCLAGMNGVEKVAAQVRFAKIWRLATDQPLPEELQT